jgi:hypothetical protein
MTSTDPSTTVDECMCSGTWDPAVHMHRLEAHPECPQHGDPHVLAQIAPRTDPSTTP